MSHGGAGSDGTVIPPSPSCVSKRCERPPNGRFERHRSGLLQGGQEAPGANRVKEQEEEAFELSQQFNWTDLICPSNIQWRDANENGSLSCFCWQEA
uniref:Uncharacterized protein n=1 Tax=Steinernema glaseri TaxID=37863 RepID=A0A1I8AAN4_9BILA